MKSHGIKFVGKLWIQRVPVLSSWTSDDVARVVFCENDQVVYVGGTTTQGDWIPIGSQWNDIGTGIDPVSGEPFLNRQYELKIENGNIILEYEEVVV
jgi:hypothetical protein